MKKHGGCYFFYFSLISVKKCREISDGKDFFEKLLAADTEGIFDNEFGRAPHHAKRNAPNPALFKSAPLGRFYAHGRMEVRKMRFFVKLSRRVKSETLSHFIAAEMNQLQNNKLQTSFHDFLLPEEFCFFPSITAEKLRSLDEIFSNWRNLAPTIYLDAITSALGGTILKAHSLLVRSGYQRCHKICRPPHKTQTRHQRRVVQQRN